MNSEGQRRIRETVRPHKFGATECATRFASSRGRDENGEERDQAQTNAQRGFTHRARRPAAERSTLRGRRDGSEAGFRVQNGGEKHE